MENKKTRVKIPNQSKVRSELQKEINSICPFCDNGEVGHFQIHHIDENPSNNIHHNLLLLCPTCHSKITKGDISVVSVYKKKIELITGSVQQEKAITKEVNFNSRVDNAVVGNNNTITIKQTKKSIKQKYPEGCIGYHTINANYIGHLVQRYNEYKEAEVGKGNVQYHIFSGHLKKQFGIPATRTIYNLPIEKFEELAIYIQSRIDKTTLAKKKGVSHKNYSTFEEYKVNFG